MILTTYLIIAVLSFLLIVVTLEFKKLIFLGLAGSVILIILGIVGLSNPLTEVTGTTTTMSATNSISVNNYTAINENINSIIGWVVVLSGFVGLIQYTIQLFDKKDAQYEKEYMHFE
jgi:hypothetical protein